MVPKKNILIIIFLITLALAGGLVAGFHWGKEATFSNTYSLGEEEGYAQGYSSASKKIYEGSFNNGLKEGYSIGYQEAYDKSYAGAYKTGYDKGYNDALKDSSQIGFIYPSMGIIDE